MGRVYLAEAREGCAVPSGTRVALKVVHPLLLSEPGFFKRFLREAEIGRAVVHPNVVRCYDADAITVEGTQQNFLVMEYVEGQTLRDLLDELGTVPEELCLHIGREVSKGLAAIHEAGVVHRDLKPENVMITPDHEVKVMDLGVARLADEAIRLSRSGVFVGSILYASPEHFEGSGEGLDGRADLFSLGVILYELSCGAHPHPGESFMQVLAKVVEDEPRHLGERNPQLSAFFEEVVHRLLAKKREERFCSCSALLTVLEQGEKSTWWGSRAKELRAETKQPLRRIRIPRETEVYGREQELERLAAFYDKAKCDDGQVVLIEGEAGIGKSRLVDELVGRLLADGEDLNFLFGSFPPGGAATASGAWSTAFREQFGAEGLEETLQDYLTVTPILVPAFAALLRGEPPPKGEEPLTKDSIQTVFVHATRALARERTTVVLIEDLHFAPEEGRAMFASLALAVPEHRILLLGTARPGISEDWRANLERLEHASRMELSRLGSKDLAELLMDAFQSERLAEELGLRIAQKSDGNPFFVFEIVRGLREGRHISSGPDGTWETTKVIQDIEIPSSVQDLIQARIAEIDEEEQELLEVASCHGFEFDPGLVAEAIGLARIPALRRFGHLEKAHRIIRSAGRSFLFDHHQVQEVLYAGISEQLREEYHAAIGDALAARHPEPDGAPAVDLCGHYLRSGQGEKALPHLDAALDHLEMGCLNDQAVALADRALETEGLVVGPDRMEILLRKAERLILIGRRSEARDAVDAALSIADASGEPLARARARGSLGWLLINLARYEEARSALLEAMDLAREAGDEKVEAEAARGLGRVSWGLERYAEAREYFERALALARKTGNRREEGMAEFFLAFSSTGPTDEVRERYERSLAIFREEGDRVWEARARANLLNVDPFPEGMEERLQWLRRVLCTFREIGDRAAECVSHANIGTALWGVGRIEEAGDSFKRSLDLAREIGDPSREARVQFGLGSVSARLGDLAAAREYFEAGRVLAAAIGTSDAHVLGTLGELAEQEGDRDEAIRLQEQALELLTESEPADTRRVHLVLGGLLVAMGRIEEARPHLEGALSLGRETDSPNTIVEASCRLCLLPGGDSAAALEIFTEQQCRLDHESEMRARYLLWKATRDLTHLDEAHRLLCHLRDHAPAEHRERMIENVPLYRDIMAAWRARRE